MSSTLNFGPEWMRKQMPKAESTPAPSPEIVNSRAKAGKSATVMEELRDNALGQSSDETSWSFIAANKAGRGKGSTTGSYSRETPRSIAEDDNSALSDPIRPFRYTTNEVLNIFSLQSLPALPAPAGFGKAWSMDALQPVLSSDPTGEEQVLRESGTGWNSYLGFRGPLQNGSQTSHTSARHADAPMNHDSHTSGERFSKWGRSGQAGSQARNGPRNRFPRDNDGDSRWPEGRYKVTGSASDDSGGPQLLAEESFRASRFSAMSPRHAEIQSQATDPPFPRSTPSVGKYVPPRLRQLEAEALLEASKSARPDGVDDRVESQTLEIAEPSDKATQSHGRDFTSLEQSHLTQVDSNRDPRQVPDEHIQRLFDSLKIGSEQILSAPSGTERGRHTDVEQYQGMLSSEAAHHPPPKHQSFPLQNDRTPEDVLWYYIDPSNRVQGPFTASVMQKWSDAGYFDAALRVKRFEDPEYVPLGLLAQQVYQHRLGNPEQLFLTLSPHLTLPGLIFEHSLDPSRPQRPMIPSHLSHQFRPQDGGSDHESRQSGQFERNHGQTGDAARDVTHAPIAIAPGPVLENNISGKPTIEESSDRYPAAKALDEKPQRHSSFQIDGSEADASTMLASTSGHLNAPTNWPDRHGHQAIKGLSAEPSLATVSTVPPSTDASSQPDSAIELKSGGEHQASHSAAMVSSDGRAITEKNSSFPNVKASTSQKTDNLRQKKERRKQKSVETPLAEEDPSMKPEKTPRRKTDVVKTSPKIGKAAPDVVSFSDLTENKDNQSPVATGPPQQQADKAPIQSLREIQNLEAKRKEIARKKSAEVSAAARSAELEKIRRDASQAEQFSGKALPGSAPWLLSPTKSSANATAPEKASPNRSLKEIQKDEERRRAMMAPRRQEGAYAQAGGASPLPSKGYVDSLNRTPDPAAGSGWSVVGSAGKATVKTPTVSTAGPVTTPEKVNKVQKAVPSNSSSKTSQREDSSPQKASKELLDWCRSSMRGLNAGINADDLIQVFLMTPLNAGAADLELISDTIYGTSTLMDGRRFASEFVSRRKADAVKNGMDPRSLGMKSLPEHKKGTVGNIGRGASLADIVSKESSIGVKDDWNSAFTVVKKKHKK